MANPIIKIKRGTLAPTAGQLQAGEFAIDQAAKNLYLGIDDGVGNITNEIVGGEGTFATKAYVATALGGVSGTLGDMAIQNKNAVDITGGTINGTSIGATIASSGKFTSLDVTMADITMSGSGIIDMNAGRITNLSAPVNANDAVRKTDLDTAIGALGSVFHYAGNVSDATTPFDLATLPDQTTGSYYRVDVAGTYVDAGYPNVEAKVGDAFVLSVATGFQKIDNVDVEVLPTANEIAVTGDENAGYTVSIDPVFSGRVSTAEGNITDLETKTQNIDNGTTAGLTSFTGDIYATGALGCDGNLNSLGDGNFNGTVTASAVDISGNITASGTVSGTNITDLETKTQNITAIAGETDVAGILTSQELWVGPNSTDAVKLLNAGGGTQAILEMPVGKEFVIKTDSGANAIKVGSGNGRVDFAYDVDVATILNAAVYSGGSANFNSLSINTSANFNGGINLNTGNLVGNGTNEITDFVIDGGVY